MADSARTVNEYRQLQHTAADWSSTADINRCINLLLFLLYLLFLLCPAFTSTKYLFTMTIEQ